MTQAPLSWLKNIEHGLEELNVIPLWGSSPPFPWDSASQAIAEALQVTHLKISGHTTEWKDRDHLFQGMASDAIVVPLEAEPLSGPFFWMMSREDVATVCSHSLEAQPRGKGFIDQRLQEGFFHFLSLKVLRSLIDCNAMPPLSFRRANATLPDSGCLCLDVRIDLNGAVLWGRILAPPQFLHNFRQYYGVSNDHAIDIASHRSLQLLLRVEIGRGSIGLSEWKNAKVGDLFILDHCSYDPTTHKGTALLSLEETPLLRARIKENTIKILNRAEYYEESHSMKEHFSEEHPEEPKEDDFEEHMTPADEEGADEIPSEEESPEHIESDEPLISHADIPLPVTVEVGRIRVSLEKLLELKPGNILDLGIHPEEGVDLTVQGKKIAKGELVKLGELLGVKILRIEN